MDGRGRVPPGAVPYHELLATRVLSVDAYWAEQRDPRCRPPNKREIPVPLWPGESRQQYEREFRRWLQSRRLSLSLVQDNPMTERNFRLGFAQTRSQKVEWQEGQRETSPSERSRSRSRSPPRHRRINGVQPPQRAYPVKVEDNRGHSPSIERRGPPGNGRPFATRLPGDRNGRSYSREPSFASPAVPPSEASRPYDKRQQVQPPDPRSRQNSPRNVSHQHVGYVKHWNRSRSRSPQYYNKAPSPPERVFATDSHRWNKSRSRSPQNFNMSRSPSRGSQDWRRPRSPQFYRKAPSPPSQVPPSASPQHRENLHKQLLARRVISVEAFRDEMFKLRNGFIHEDDLKRPHETMVRIPVILWPGESMALYKQKFERWLDSRNVSLATLRDNPARERSLWHSFAYTRAGTSDFAEPGRLHAESRSPPRARSRSRSRSPHRVQSRLRSCSRSKSPPPRKLHERGRSPISGTSFIRRPVNKAYASSTAHLHTPPSEPPQPSMSPSSTIIPPEDDRLYSNKTRRQLLERRILPLDDFQKEVDQNIGAAYTSAAQSNILHAIPVPLFRGESMGLYDYRFWGWLKGFNESKDSLRSNPARERRFRMKFAYLRVNQPQVSGTTGEGGHRAPSNRPNLYVHIKIPLDVPKSARAQLAMNAKKMAGDSEHHTRQTHERTDSKRARVNTEAGTQDNVLLVNTSTTTVAEISSQLTSTVSPLETTKTLARPSMVEATPGSIGSERSSIPLQANSGSLRVESRTRACTRMVPSTQKRPAAIIPNSMAPQRSAHLVQNSKPAAAVISKPANTAGAATPSRSSAAPLQNITSRLGQAVFTSQSSTASQQKNASRPEPAPRTPAGKPVEATALQASTTSQQRIAPRPDSDSRNSVVTPVDSHGGSRSLIVIWKKRRLGSVAGTSLSSLVSKSAPPPSPAMPPAEEAPRNLSAEKLRDSPAPAAPVASALHRSSPIASRPTTTTDTSNANAVASTIENVADARSEPGTTLGDTTAHEMSDVGSNPGVESEEHDGDVMNPDGCCCTKCMRIWARTLTDRMDQLEQNVVDLKREVVTQIGTTVISS